MLAPWRVTCGEHLPQLWAAPVRRLCVGASPKPSLDRSRPQGGAQGCQRMGCCCPTLWRQPSRISLLCPPPLPPSLRGARFWDRRCWVAGGWCSCERKEVGVAVMLTPSGVIWALPSPGQTQLHPGPRGGSGRLRVSGLSPVSTSPIF